MYMTVGIVIDCASVRASALEVLFRSLYIPYRP
jgi:hypothetical protein